MSNDSITREDAEAYRIATEMYDAGQKAAEAWMQFRQDKDACGLAFVYIERAIGKRMVDVGARLTKGKSGEYFTSVSCGSLQSINALEHVAKAMVESLKSNGVKARVESRLD